MKRWAFTFGSIHTTWPGVSLENRYTIIEADSYGDARKKMMGVCGDKWAFQYEANDAFWEQRDKFGMKEIFLETLMYNSSQEDV